MKDIIRNIALTVFIFAVCVGSAYAVVNTKKTYAATYYTITFNLRGGTGNIASQTVISGGTISRPTNPTKEGYTFKWWTNLMDDSEFNFATPVTSDISLRAVWTKNQYTITFNSNGGSSVSSQTVSYGDTISKPSNPTRDGYTFKYWSTSSSGSEYNFNTTVNSNMTLYAIWEQNASSGGGNSSGGSSSSGGGSSANSGNSGSSNNSGGNSSSGGSSNNNSGGSSSSNNNNGNNNTTTEEKVYTIKIIKQGLPYIDTTELTLKENATLEQYNQSNTITVFDTTTYSVTDSSSCSSVLSRIRGSEAVNTKCNNINNLLTCNADNNCFGNKYVVLSESGTEEILYLKNNNVISVNLTKYNYIGLYKDSSCSNKYTYTTKIKGDATIYECYSTETTSNSNITNNTRNNKNAGKAVTTILIILAILSVIGFIGFLVFKSKKANSV